MKNLLSPCALQAYRQLSKAYHPDKNKEPGAIDVFRKLTKAHDVLMNEDSRKLFNQYLNHEVVRRLCRPHSSCICMVGESLSVPCRATSTCPVSTTRRISPNPTCGW